MQKRDAPCLVFGVLLIAVASCRPSHNDNVVTSPQPERVETSTIATLSAVGTVSPAGGSTSESAHLPSPSPDDWLMIGEPRAGLSLSIPPAWINLTGQLNAPAMGNRLGINLLFAAESEKAGRSLLAGKSFADGAYVSGLLVAPPAAGGDPSTALVELLAAAAPAAVRLTEVTPIVSANGVAGYVVDVVAGPIGLNVTERKDLRTRVALFMPAPAGGERPAPWIALLLSASVAHWERRAPQFDRMLQSVAVYEVLPGTTIQEGKMIMRGELEGNREQVVATLGRSAGDLWVFAIADDRYASITLVPDESHLDLSMTLLGPDRRAVAEVDHGHAGTAESTADLLLAEPGSYIIEVDDFHGASGRYTLSLTLSNQPQHAAGGSITFGQALQASLPANGQQYWVFSGLARQRVSIVLEPGAAAFDPVMELYGPGDRQLAIRDEGTAGLPELIADFELPLSGEYAVLVRGTSPQPGSYSISLVESRQPVENIHDAGDLAYGSVRTGTLQSREAHVWFVPGRAGDHVLIRVNPFSANLDLDVWLLDNRGEQVAAVDEFAAGEAETVELTLAADGQYAVLVRDFNGEPGEYEIVLGAAPVATPEYTGSLNYGDAVISAVPPGAAVAWTFNAQAGDIIDIEAQAGDASSDLVMVLRGPDGLSAFRADDNPAGDEAIRAFVVPAAGSWQIVISEFFGNTAGYRLRLERAAP